MALLSQVKDSRAYNITTDPNASSLVLAMPFNKESGLRDVSHLIRGTGTEFTNIIRQRYDNGDIIGHESCFYDSCLRCPYTPYQGVLEMNTPQLTGTTALGTQSFTVEFWVKFDTFDFEAQFDVMYPPYIDTVDPIDDVPYIVLTGDTWPTVGERRGLQVRRGTGIANSTVITNINNSFTVGTWYHVAVTRSGSTFYIGIGTKNSQGSGVTIDGIASNENIGARGIIVNSGSSDHIFTGYNYIFFSRTFNKGRMPIGVYLQDFRYYIGVAKYTTTYRVPEPIFTY